MFIHLENLQRLRASLKIKAFFHSISWIKGQVHVLNIILFRMTLSNKNGNNNACTFVIDKLHALNINLIAEECIT